MGKKSRRKGQTKAAAPAIYDTVFRLAREKKHDELLKVESKYRHLENFSNNPAEDAFVLSTFGMTMNIQERSQEEAIHYYERAIKVYNSISIQDEALQAQKSTLKSKIVMKLAGLYSKGRDMEKAISTHRCLLENCSNREDSAIYMINLSRNFNRFEKFEYTIEVLEGSMDMMETSEEKLLAAKYLILAYFECGEFLKAKAADETRRSTDVNPHLTAELQSGRIEEELCNYKAAIAHCRKGVDELQKQECDDSLGGATRVAFSVVLARNLLRHSADNEAEAFAIFQEELDRCVDPLDKKEILFQMGIGYGKLNKWDQSIEALHQLCLSSTRPADGTMALQANTEMAQTYLEQYCTDTNLNIDQRTAILNHATNHCIMVDESPTEMHLIIAQIVYCDGDKQQAYHHLELYLDARLAECKLSCYTCNQRVRHGSVPFSCASCRVASYCGRKHQKMTWKNERICHKVLCPLLGYWRMAKKKKKQKKHKGLTDEDRCEYDGVFETFFGSICPRVKTCIPL